MTAPVRGAAPPRPWREAWTGWLRLDANWWMGCRVRAPAPGAAAARAARRPPCPGWGSWAAGWRSDSMACSMPMTRTGASPGRSPSPRRRLLAPRSAGRWMRSPVARGHRHRLPPQTWAHRRTGPMTTCSRCPAGSGTPARARRSRHWSGGQAAVPVGRGPCPAPVVAALISLRPQAENG